MNKVFLAVLLTVSTFGAASAAQDPTTGQTGQSQGDQEDVVLKPRQAAEEKKPNQQPVEPAQAVPATPTKLPEEGSVQVAGPEQIKPEPIQPYCPPTSGPPAFPLAPAYRHDVRPAGPIAPVTGQLRHSRPVKSANKVKVNAKTKVQPKHGRAYVPQEGWAGWVMALLTAVLVTAIFCTPLYRLFKKAEKLYA